MESIRIVPAASSIRRHRAVLEIVLVFAVFFVQGAWPVPDVNEPYYLGKAIHYWNPQWIPHDFFLDSADTHKAFYFTLGWLSLWLEPTTMAWVARVATWALLAWAWWRLSWALVPRPWIAVLTAALFVCASERCSMAGEWVVGGVEAKGFAYVLVLLGMEAVVRGRWNRAWILFGGAALFHVLVGGWSVVAGGIAWWLSGSERPRVRSILPGLAAGLLLSLPGLIPSLSLTWGTPPDIVARANWIYVYERLPHHLVMSSFASLDVLRFGGLLLVWLWLCRHAPRIGPTGRLQGFVAGSLAIALVGMALNAVALVDPGRAAGLLRFYWFRLVDVMVPAGVVLLGSWWIGERVGEGARRGKWLLAAACVVALVHVGMVGAQRLTPTVPRTVSDYNWDAWRDVCEWIAHSGTIPPDARFMTPRLNHTFKWYAGRSEVASWKDVPQDARSIVQWWDRLQRMYGTGVRSSDPELEWRRSLTLLEPEQLRELGARYQADYVLTACYPPLELEVLYENEIYAVYRLNSAKTR